MALLHESAESKRLDVRLIERNLARGVITHEQLKKAEQELPDDSDNAEWISVESLMDEVDMSEGLSNGKASHH